MPGVAGTRYRVKLQGAKAATWVLSLRPLMVGTLGLALHCLDVVCFVLQKYDWDNCGMGNVTDILCSERVVGRKLRSRPKVLGISPPKGAVHASSGRSRSMSSGLGYRLGQHMQSPTPLRVNPLGADCVRSCMRTCACVLVHMRTRSRVRACARVCICMHAPIDCNFAEIMMPAADVRVCELIV